MQDLESMLIADMVAGKQVELERALLIVSGADTEEKIAEYKRKLDSIQESFREYLSNLSVSGQKKQTPLRTAKALHNFVWQSNPNRYQYNGEFLLTKVIDSQLNDNPDTPVGNCVGLTSLYTVLGQRLGLDLSVVSPPEHVLCVLHHGEKNYPIENTYPQWFQMDMESYKNRFGMDLIGLKKDPPVFLAADILNWRGVSKYESGKCRRAISDFDKAIKINPDYADAYNHRAISKKVMEDFPGATADYDKAIELKPDYSSAYNNRGILKYMLDDEAGAIADYDKAIELTPDDAEIYTNRGAAKYFLEDYKGAMADFSTALMIDPNYELARKNITLCESAASSGNHAA
jgi:tetratricopeptide (TPR) repeat protein